MTDSTPPGTPATTACLASLAQRAARAAIAHTTLRTAPEASSAEAVRIARELELAVQAEVRARIRRVCEAGESWAAVAALLSLGPIAAERPAPWPRWPSTTPPGPAPCSPGTQRRHRIAGRRSGHSQQVELR